MSRQRRNDSRGSVGHLNLNNTTMKTISKIEKLGYKIKEAVHCNSRGVKVLVGYNLFDGNQICNRFPTLIQALNYIQGKNFTTGSRF